MPVWYFVPACFQAQQAARDRDAIVTIDVLDFKVRDADLEIRRWRGWHSRLGGGRCGGDARQPAKLGIAVQLILKRTQLAIIEDDIIIPCGDAGVVEGHAR